MLALLTDRPLCSFNRRRASTLWDLRCPVYISIYKHEYYVSITVFM